MGKRFKVQLVLDQVKGIVENNPNHCDFDFYKELIVKLEKYLELQSSDEAPASCDMCDKPCGNDWCPTNGDKE